MNTLSWFLILAEIYGNLKVAAGFGFYLLLTGIVAYKVFFTALHGCNISEYDRNWHPEAYKAAKDFFANKVFYLSRSLSILLATLFTVTVGTPSVQTLYLVASSEAAEMAITSQEGAELLQDLRDILKAQLTSLKGEN